MSSVAPFEALVADVYGPVQRYLRRRTDPATADDVLGDVLLVMWRRADEIPSESALAWCYGVARRCLANAVRGSERHLKLVQRLASEPALAEPQDDPVLAEALRALPERDRELLRLWAWEQFTATEIAVVLGITPNAASLRLHRATKKLKRQLVERKDRGVPGHRREREGEETR